MTRGTAVATGEAALPTCCGRLGSRTSSPTRGAARCCRRRRRTSSRSSSAACSSTRFDVVTPWLEVCRDAVGDIRGVLAELPTRVEREPVLARGEGGDDTTAIDAAAETAVVHRLEQLDQDFTLVSEELGERVFGTGTPWRIVCDPIDGSLNAKRNIPFFSLSLAVADGDTMGDVVFGYVYDFGTGEEWTAERGRGAFLNGARLGAVRPKDSIEILSFEATTTAAGRRQGGGDGRNRRTASGSWARSRSRSATSPRAASTPSARSSPRARSTSRPASCSSASAASRSSCSRTRRSSRHRSTSSDVHESSPRVPPSCATRWKPPLPHRLLGGYPRRRPGRRSSPSTNDWEGFGPRNALRLRELLHEGVTLIRLTIPAPTASPTHGGPSTSAHTRP